MTVVTQIGSGERAEEIRSEPAVEVTQNYHPNHFCPEDGRSIFVRTVGVQLVTTMNAALSSRAIPQPSMCLHCKLQTNCTFTFTNVLFPADHSTVCSASTCAVFGFASWRAAQVSAVAASRYKRSRPLGGSGCRALSEEGTARR